MSITFSHSPVTVQLSLTHSSCLLSACRLPVRSGNTCCLTLSVTLSDRQTACQIYRDVWIEALIAPMAIIPLQRSVIGKGDGTVDWRLGGTLTVNLWVEFSESFGVEVLGFRGQIIE